MSVPLGLPSEWQKKGREAEVTRQLEVTQEIIY